MKRLKKSANTGTPVLAQIVTKIAWSYEGPNRTKLSKSAFARVLAYSANFADRYCGADFNLSIRDFVQGGVSVPFNSEHTGVNMHYWRFADLAEWQCFAPDTIFAPSQIDLTPRSVYRLPVLEGMHYRYSPLPTPPYIFRSKPSLFFERGDY